ncbi:MAG: UDP-N-acetylmuramate--L-alanine ligase [Phycisphaerales bacterium]
MPRDVMDKQPQAAAEVGPARSGSAGFDVRGKHVYLIGIGGSGMSGLARLLASRGAAVSGSDRERSDLTDELASRGVAVSYDQSTQTLPEVCDLVVASAAVRPDHPQMLAATARGLPALTYAEALGRCMIGRTGIGVAGTHGKSSTVAMLGYTLIQSGLEPSVIVGATCAQLGDPVMGVGSCAFSAERIPDGSAGVRGSVAGGARGNAGFRIGADVIPIGAMKGRPGVLVAESCEFNRSFHNLHPTLGVILNVEADHLDVYGSLDAVVEAFRDFARLLPPASEGPGGGWLLIGHEGAHRREVTAGVHAKIETIGFSPEADWVVSFDAATRSVALKHHGKHAASWTLRVPGLHMAYNSAVAMAVTLHLGADAARAAAAMENFRGVDRRMQYLGEKNPGGIARSGVRVYDDYGHHPTEIDATLRALREFERPEDRGGRLVCVFQPHQHSRTRFLLEEFAQSFSKADIVIVPHIYFVRDSEIEKQKVSASDLVDRLRQRGVQAMHRYPFEAIVEQLQNVCRPGDLLVVMGAGPVWQVAKGYLEAGGMFGK